MGAAILFCGSTALLWISDYMDTGLPFCFLLLYATDFFIYGMSDMWPPGHLVLSDCEVLLSEVQKNNSLQDTIRHNSKFLFGVFNHARFCILLSCQTGNSTFWPIRWLQWNGRWNCGLQIFAIRLDKVCECFSYYSLARTQVPVLAHGFQGNLTFGKVLEKNVGKWRLCLKKPFPVSCSIWVRLQLYNLWSSWCSLLVSIVIHSLIKLIDWTVGSSLSFISWDQPFTETTTTTIVVGFVSRRSVVLANGRFDTGVHFRAANWKLSLSCIPLGILSIPSFGVRGTGRKSKADDSQCSPLCAIRASWIDPDYFWSFSIEKLLFPWHGWHETISAGWNTFNV